MLRRSTSTRTASAVLAAGLGLALVAAVAPASATPAAPAAPAAPVASAALVASGPYSAAADASLADLQIPALIDEVLPETEVDVARSSANAESDNDLDSDKPGAQRTGAIAQTTGNTSLLGAPIELQVTEASAPPAEAKSDTLIPLDLAPLLDLPVINTSAIANWVSDTECVAADTPLSHADQALADLTLLEVGDGQTVAELDTDNGDGATDTEASTFLASIPGENDPRAVAAHATTNVSSANVLNGLVPDVTSAIQVDVVQQPNYVASATGLPGGATITGDDPVVTVAIGGDDVINLDGAGDTTHEASLTEIALGDLLGLTDTGLLTNLVTDLGLPLDVLTDAIDDAVLQLLDTLSPVVRLTIPVTKETSADGTHARVEASILRVEVLAPELPDGPLTPVTDAVGQILAALGANIDEPLIQLDLGPLAAEANAPAGGITCGEPNNPLREVNKHASATEVAPGGTFEYNIAVPNRGPCTVEDVKVTDVVTGPGGFEIIDTEPDGTVNGGNISWDLGDLEPNETVNLTVTIQVPANAADGATFDDAVTASGTCDGRPVSEDDRVDDIPVVRTDFTGGCNVQFSNKDASHIQVTPGETFSYYVHAFNSGGEPCNNVTITDTLDDRVSFVSCNKSCTHEGQNVSWKLATLGGGSSAILSVVVQVDDDANGILENAAVITPENGSPTTVRTRGPVIGPDSIPKDPGPASRRPLPKTGLPMATGLALALGLAGYGLYALRRRSSIV